jgi:amino acid transporter, AAT family
MGHYFTIKERGRHSVEKKSSHLQKGLLPRHVQFIALAGMIGTGIFKGSSDTLAIAGPSVVLAYLAGGVLLFIVMAALGEMAISYPQLNVQHLVHKAFGSRFSFMVGWLYWINWVIVTTVELLAGGSFLQFWLPNIPLWILGLICALVVICVNLFSVKYYGELEFWFAGVKIIALIAFIVLGILMVTGAVPSGIRHPLSNYTSHGGIFPHGLKGTISAFLVVMFSYGGAELIGVAVTETKDSKKVLPKIIKGTVWRVIIFYVLPIFIICGLVPWDKVTGANSPFVQVFSAAGLPGAANIMNFVLLTAVLSAANSGVYATSRTLYSLSQSGEAPKWFLRLTKNGIPINGVVLTGILTLMGVYLAFLTPSQVISYLMTIPGFTVMIIWIAICLSQIKLRKGYKETPFFQVKGFPYTTILAIAALFIIFVSFLFNKDNIIGTSVSIGIIAILIILSYIIKKPK